MASSAKELSLLFGRGCWVSSMLAIILRAARTSSVLSYRWTHRVVQAVHQLRGTAGHCRTGMTLVLLAGISRFKILAPYHPCQSHYIGRVLSCRQRDQGYSNLAVDVCLQGSASPVPQQLQQQCCIHESLSSCCQRTAGLRTQHCSRPSCSCCAKLDPEVSAASTTASTGSAACHRSAKAAAQWPLAGDRRSPAIRVSWE